MKKIMAVLLSVLLALSLVSCSGGGKDDGTDTTDTGNGTNTTDTGDTADTTGGDTGGDTTDGGSDIGGAEEGGNNGDNNEESNLDSELLSILDSVYDNSGVDEWPMFSDTEITKDNMEYYFGTTDFDFDKAIAREPLVSAIAHSVCVIRLNEGADVEDVKTKIKENVDPRKWICVGVEDENVHVENQGNIVILIMDNDYGTKLTDSFKALTDIG